MPYLKRFDLFLSGIFGHPLNLREKHVLLPVGPMGSSRAIRTAVISLETFENTTNYADLLKGKK